MEESTSVYKPTPHFAEITISITHAHIRSLTYYVQAPKSGPLIGWSPIKVRLSPMAI